MIIIAMNRDGYFGPEAMIKAGVKYVMADALAHGIRSQAAGNILHFEKFDDYYKKYNGEDLNGKSIIVWRTGGFGDLLFVSSLIRSMKIRYPGAKINVATSARFADVWEFNKDLAAGHAFFLPIPLETILKHDYHLKFEGTIEEDKDPDQLPAVDRFALEAGLVLRETEKLPYFPGVMDVFTTARNVVNKSLGVYLRPLKYGCIQFKSSSIVRDWDYVRMLELADKLANKYNMPMLIMGNGFYLGTIEATQKEYEKLYDEPLNKNVINLTRMFDPKTNKEGLRFIYSSGLIGSAAFVVTIDSALVHVAAATYTPCVSLYGPFPGKIRTLYYPRNITIEKENSCPAGPCLIHTRSGEGENALPLDVCKPLPEEKPFNFCRMMTAITVKDVMERVEKAMILWGNESVDDRKKMIKEREAYGTC